MAASTVSGLQWSGVANIIAQGSNVVQMAAGFNISLETMKGVQFAVGNFADTIKGVQVGLFNVSAKVKKGVQIGIVNYYNERSGIHIGLINMTPQSRLQLMLFAGNYAVMNVAGRIKNQHNYYIFGMGTPYDLDMDFSGSVFFRRGYSIPLKRLSLNADLGFAHIMMFDNDNYKDEPLQKYSLQGRLSAEYKLRQRLSVFVSGGYALASPYRATQFDRKPIAEAGIVLF